VTSPREQRIIADATIRVLDLLGALAAGDTAMAARLNAEAPKDPEYVAALFAAALGAADRALNVLRSVNPEEAVVTMASFRAEALEYREGC
jgi:predicted regulator of Ras-like GTPase activity (Roadblock/LC7/MglB family)